MTDPTDMATAWRPRVALLGAALAGLGLVMWVASQWAGWGRATQLGLVQGALAVGLVGAALTGARAAFALLGWLAIGALFALIGQTYQLGADPWQLFALWTLLGLPVALAARHDAVWSGWALVAVLAVGLWVAGLGARWRFDPTPPQHALGAALLLCAVWLGVGPLAARWTGAGRWPPRVALVAALVVLVTMGVIAAASSRLMSGWLAPPNAQWGMLPWWVALAAVGAMAAALRTPRLWDLAQLSAAALALLVLLLTRPAIGLLGSPLREPVLGFMGLGLLAAVLLAALAWAVLRLHAWQSGAQPAWPVAVLTGLGAWLAAVPLLGGLGILMGVAFQDAFWLVGLALLIAAVVVLRRPGLGPFAEQLMVPVLLAGILGCAFGAAAAADHARWLGGAVGLAVSLVAAALLPQPWLRGALGALAVAAAAQLLAASGDTALTLAALVLLVPWLLAARWRAHPQGRAVWLGWAAGWLALAVWAGGPTFLVAGLTGSPGMGHPVGQGAGELWVMAASAAFALLAPVLLARTQPAVRRAAALLPAAVWVLLSAAVTPLGGVGLVGVLAWRDGVRSLAALAVLAALWLVGTLYYQLGWPLAYKGLALLVAGALLALAVWRPRGPRAAVARRPAALLLGALAVTLALANHRIWQEEAVLAQGRTVYLALAPVDPRSLMQGDFMQLAFELPAEVREGHVQDGDRVALRVDARGVATVVKVLHGAETPADGEWVLPLRRHDAQWGVVTDAYFFPEGQANRFLTARFGIVRLTRDGRATLTGLADAEQRPL